MTLADVTTWIFFPTSFVPGRWPLSKTKWKPTGPREKSLLATKVFNTSGIEPCRTRSEAGEFGYLGVRKAFNSVNHRLLGIQCRTFDCLRGVGGPYVAWKGEAFDLRTTCKAGAIKSWEPHESFLRPFLVLVNINGSGNCSVNPRFKLAGMWGQLCHCTHACDVPVSSERC